MEEVLLSGENIEYKIDNEVLFESVNVSVSNSDRIGFIGVNGSGKSTLLKILSSSITPNKGSVYCKSSIYYLPQLDSNYFIENISIYDYIKNISYDLFSLSLGISNFERDLSTLSGGEFLKLHLEIIKYINPGIILMDEPTNNLDLESINYLKDFLLLGDKTFVIVSHNFNFLNQLVEKIWDLDNKSVTSFKGNLYSYLEEKKNIKSGKENRYKSKNKELERLTKDIIKNTKIASKSPGKIKKLRKKENDHKVLSSFKAKINFMSGYSNSIIDKKITQTKKELDALKIEKRKNINPLIFKSNRDKSNLLIGINGANLFVGEVNLIENINFKIYYGERILISGNNGVGKSSFIKSIFENNVNIKLIPSAYKAENLNFAYLSQIYSNIDYTLNIEENMLKSNSNLSYTLIRQQLGNYLFYTDFDIHKKVSDLSGGELARLSFAISSARDIDILILDEPTNNLDRDTSDILLDNLVLFDGSIILISHDIDFINALNIDKTYNIKDRKLLYSNKI